jgi:nucleotide-binding universal stress UspA family protein
MPACPGRLQELSRFAAQQKVGKRMKNILVLIDFSEITGVVIEHAAGLARAFAGKIWLLHVAVPCTEAIPFNVDHGLARKELAKEFHSEHRRLQALAERLRADGVATTALLVQGNIVKTIVTEAQRLKADLIVLGLHGHGRLYQTLPDGTSRGLLRRASCPIYVLPPRPQED